MYHIVAEFVNGNGKSYSFCCNTSLLVGAKYNIFTDREYSNPIVVQKSFPYEKYSDSSQLKLIRRFVLIDAPQRPFSKIKNVYFNPTKRTTTVKWYDNTTTTVRCHPEDEYDKEKGIAMCFMKRCYGNRGCFNNEFKKYIDYSENIKKE